MSSPPRGRVCPQTRVWRVLRTRQDFRVALEFLLDKGFSPDMGARPLRRAIDQYLLAPLAGRPALPALGQAIPQAFLCPFLLEDESDAHGFEALLKGALAQAATLGIGVATVGMALEHPWRGWLSRQVRPMEYRTRLHAVHWGTEREILPPGAMAMPEAALL